MSKSKSAGMMLLLVAPFIAAAGITWLVYSDKAARLAEAQAQLENMLRIANTDVGQYATVSISEVAKNSSLGTDTPAVLAANLQSRLREIASANGVDIYQASDLAMAEAENGVQKVGLRLEMSGPFKGVHTFVLQIEQSVPWLFVDNFQLRSGYLDGNPLAVEPPMQMTLDVWGLRLTVEPSATP